MKNNIARLFIIICIITGIANLSLRMINRRLKIDELGEIAAICGTVFVVCLLFFVAIWLIKSFR